MPLSFWLHFLDSRAEIHQMFALVLWKIEDIKSHSEINWPLVNERWRNLRWLCFNFVPSSKKMLKINVCFRHSLNQRQWFLALFSRWDKNNIHWNLATSTLLFAWKFRVYYSRKKVKWQKRNQIFIIVVAGCPMLLFYTLSY